MTTTTPDLSNVDHLSFAPVSSWHAGEYDPAELLEALKAQPALADFEDEQGNIQSAVRLDFDVDPANVGLWVSVPDGTAESVVDAAVAACKPAPAPTAADPLVPASVAVQTAVAAAMATVAITSTTLTADQKTAIQAKVTAAVQAVVDAHLDAAG